jgi:hypothetical protein
MPAITPGAAPRITASATPEISQAQRVERYLERLHRAGFYGKVVISFQNGQINDIKTEQTKKLDEL